MHGLYDKLQNDCKTGPFMMRDGQKVLKPFEEYPKWVRKADGTRVIVKDIREEATMAGDLAMRPANDPLASEREALAAKGDELDASRRELDELKASMRAQLDELAQARASLQGQGTVATAALAKPAAAVGSSYRLPKDAKGPAPSVAVEPEKVT